MSWSMWRSCMIINKSLLFNHDTNKLSFEAITVTIIGDMDSMILIFTMWNQNRSNKTVCSAAQIRVTYIDWVWRHQLLRLNRVTSQHRHLNSTCEIAIQYDTLATVYATIFSVSLWWIQEAQLSQRDRATLRVIEYFAKSLSSLKVIRNNTVE